jgi:hypothetical protein
MVRKDWRIQLFSNEAGVKLRKSFSKKGGI